MGVAPKSKGPASDSFMTADKMKPLLALSKREPVQAAFGLTTDGDGVLLLDKKMKPKKVLSVLKATAGKSKIQLQPSTLRFGKAEVDTDYDSGMVRFFINKEAPGNMRSKLVEVVKRIPYQKVELNVDPSLEDEPEEDGESPAEPGQAGEVTDPVRAEYETRMAEFEPRLLQALQAQHPESSRLRAISAFAQEKAGGGDFASGLKAIDVMVKLLDGGQTAPSTAPVTGEPEDPSRAFNARLAALIPLIQKAANDGMSEAADLRKQAGDAGGAARDKDYTHANEMLDSIESVIETANTSGKAKLAAWQSARQDAVDDIEEVIDAIKESADPDGKQVEIVLASIVKNLTESPATQQQYDELLRYVQSDDVLTAAEEVPAGYGTLDLRAPLLAALTGAY